MPQFTIARKGNAIIGKRVNLIYLVWALCLIGSIWQIFQVSKLYFAYPSTVEMFPDRPPELKVPAVTICAPIGHVVNRTAFFEAFPEIEHTVNKIKADPSLSESVKDTRILRVIEKKILEVPINVQDEVTVNANEVISICGTARPIFGKLSSVPEPRVLCSWISSYRTYYFKYSKCFTLFSRPENDTYIIDRDFVEIMVVFHLNQSFIRYGQLIFHPPYEPPRFSKNNWIGIHPEKQQRLFVSFTKSSVVLLPPPYPTQCKEYKTEGYSSREDCLEKCMTSLYETVENRWPPEVASLPNQTMKLSTQSNYSNYAEIRRKCNLSCGRRQDCVHGYYEMEKYLEVWRKAGEEHLPFVVGILSPKGLDTTYKHKARVEVIEYVCYLASLLSLWFGASARSLFLNLEIVVKEVKKSKTRTKAKSRSRGKEPKGSRGRKEAAIVGEEKWEEEEGEREL